jgi:hypothetical protein
MIVALLAPTTPLNDEFKTGLIERVAAKLA